MLAGKRIFLTGAAGGVGTALVACCREAGAQVVGLDRDAKGLDALEGCPGAVVDLTDRAALSETLPRLIDRYGPPDIVISNAGWTRAEILADTGPAEWDTELDLNLTSAHTLTRAVLPALRARGGALVYVASINALAHYGNPAYAAAKAGLLALMRAVATEEAANGIRANAVCPGSIRTAAWDHRIAAQPDILDRVRRLYPMGRLVEPREVAHAIAFLASDLASGITGAVLPVDAGISAGNLPFIREIVQ